MHVFKHAYLQFPPIFKRSSSPNPNPSFSLVNMLSYPQVGQLGNVQIPAIFKKNLVKMLGYLQMLGDL